jgi:hypothetical protein
MQFPKLKVLVDAGVVREVAVSYAADTGGWVAHVTYATRNGERTEPLERQRGGARVFATLDAVARAVAGVGLSAFQVHVAGLPGAEAEPP